jgi:single-stranded DNA-binding protein
MTALALIAGAIFKAAERRESKTAGRSFVVATIRTRDGNASDFWNVTAFDGMAQDELARLEFGDQVSVQGRLQVELYTKDGVSKISRSLVADRVLALRQPARRGRRAEPDVGEPWAGPP